MRHTIERRRHHREVVHIGATAVMPDGLTRHPVLVVNLSQSGALVALSKPLELPPTFTLLFEHKLQPCEVVWRQAVHAGVQFVE